MSTRDEAAGAACARKTNVLSLDTCWKEQRCGSTHELKLREQLVPGGRAWCRWTRGRAREQTKERKHAHAEAAGAAGACLESERRVG